MRKFWIEYDDGRALDLNGGSHYSASGASVINHAYLDKSLFFIDPTGLGVSFDAGSVYAGEYGRATTYFRQAQIVIAGTLCIAPTISRTAYSNYPILASLITGKKVTLHYNATSSPAYSNSYSIDGYVTKLTKTELKAGVLYCGFEFRAVTQWYKKAASASTNIVKANSSQSIIAQAYGSSIDMTLTATEAVSNLVLSVMKGDVLLGCLDFGSASIASGQIIRWKTDPSDPLVTIDGSDALSSINLFHEPFPILSSTCTLVGGSTMTGKMNMTYSLINYFGGV